MLRANYRSTRSPSKMVDSTCAARYVQYLGQVKLLTPVNFMRGSFTIAIFGADAPDELPWMESAHIHKHVRSSCNECSIITACWSTAVD